MTVDGFQINNGKKITVSINYTVNWPAKAVTTWHGNIHINMPKP